MRSLLVPFGLKPVQKEPHTGPYYADIYVRALAAAIDIVLLFTILEKPFNALMMRIFTGIDQEAFSKAQEAPTNAEKFSLLWQSHMPQLWLLNCAIQVFWIGVFMVGFQCWLRTTPGKWLLGLRIVRANTLEEPARWRYILRFVAYIPASAPLMLGIFWMSFNKRRRAWQDMIAGTVVIHKHPPGHLWRQIKRFYHWIRERWIARRASIDKND